MADTAVPTDFTMRTPLVRPTSSRPSLAMVAFDQNASRSACRSTAIRGGHHGARSCTGAAGLFMAPATRAIDTPPPATRSITFEMGPSGFSDSRTGRY